MTNNYEENILKGVKDSSYSLESSIELLQKDVVQLHAPRYQSMRRVSITTQWVLHCQNCLVKKFCNIFLTRFCISKGCDRLYPGDGLHPLAPQRYWEDCLSPVLQMERGGTWTIQACSGMNESTISCSRTLGLCNISKYSKCVYCNILQ